MSDTKIYTNHTGGAQGSDLEWELAGRKYGVDSIAYSFVGHNQFGRCQRILSEAELAEGSEKAKAASIPLNRPWKRIEENYYALRLISRNWFQVKNATAIYAIGRFANKLKTIVDGGTGWAVQMAILEGKTVYFFNQDDCMWYTYSSIVGKFTITGGTPTLVEDFAGIGTREITPRGKKAISDVYDKTFNKKEMESTVDAFFET